MQEILKIANELADLSGEVIKKYFRKDFTSEIKDNSSPIVTIADKEAEQAMCQILKEKRPEDSIIGEEWGEVKGGSEYSWILDPIDGTSSFASGFPIFGTLIGVFKENKPMLGIMSQPILGERWIGINGQKTNLNGKEIMTSNTENIENAIMRATTPGMFYGWYDSFIPRYKLGFDNLSSKIKKLGWGGDCYNYTMLASGQVDIVIETDLKFYDIAALIPIIEGAGGIITDWDGNPINVNSRGDVIASANKTLHQKVLEEIKG